MRTKAEAFIHRHFEAVYQGEEFLAMPFDQLAQLLSSEAVSVTSEEFTFRGASVHQTICAVQCSGVQCSPWDARRASHLPTLGHFSLIPPFLPSAPLQPSRAGSCTTWRTAASTSSPSSAPCASRCVRAFVLAFPLLALHTRARSLSLPLADLADLTEGRG